MSILARLFGRRQRRCVSFADSFPTLLKAEAADDIHVEEVSGEMYAYECNHAAPRAFRVAVYGELSPLKTSSHLCPECYAASLKRTTIRCAKCRRPIFKEMPVALYGQGHPDLHLDIATLANGRVVGCSRPECCHSDHHLAGHWTGAAIRVSAL